MSSQQPAQDPVHAGKGLRARLGESGWTRTRAVLSLGMVLGLGAVGTMAAWTDQATATTGVFSTSSMQMKVDGKTSTHEFAALAQQFEYVDQTFAGNIAVENTGTQNFAWEVAGAVTDDPDGRHAGIAQNLQVTVFDGSAIGDSTCDGNDITGQARTLDVDAEPDVVCVQIGLDDYGTHDRFKIGTLGLEFTAVGQ